MFSVTASDADRGRAQIHVGLGRWHKSVTTNRDRDARLQQKSVFTLRVYADDLTGITGHNVSGSNSVTVVTPTPHAPSIVSFTASASTVEIGQPVTFTGVVKDQDGGVLRMTYNYGGGVYDVWNSATTIANEEVTHAEANTFSTAGSKTSH